MTTTLDPAALQLITIDPATIRTVDQIRQSATPDEAMIESVRASGILQPPTVTWSEEDQAYYLLFGARRVGAAIIAGLTEIPAIVRPAESLTEALTLEEQIVENERREAVSPGDLARGYARLELFGESVADIAARTGERPERITAGIRAARSEKATTLLASRPALDLEQAAQLTEFDEHPAVQRDLAEVAVDKPQDFDWKLRAARDKIAKDTRTAELKAEIRAAKVKLAKTDGYGGLKSGTVHIDGAVYADGKKITAKNHASCPGHRAYIAGYRVDDMKISYACEGFRDHGHKFPGSAPRELTEDEKAANAAREEREAAVVANRAARRQWIHDLLPGKINQLPGVYEYMAAALLSWGYDDHRAPSQTLALLDVEVDGTGYRAASDALDELTKSKRIAPYRLMLATALGIHEKVLERGTEATAIARHFEQLAKWGYQLTEIDTTALDAARTALANAAAAAAAAASDEGAGE